MRLEEIYSIEQKLTNKYFETDKIEELTNYQWDVNSVYRNVELAILCWYALQAGFGYL